jgi:hypothetical protein
MFGHSYYHGAIRKYIIMFGNMFNDIKISRFDRNGNRVQVIKVPIAYGPREKYLARLTEDPNLNRPVAIQLPRLSFEITSMTYSSTRTLNKLQRNTAIGATNDTLRSQFAPVPYDINVSLYGMFANNEDAIQVVEQILPFFRPEWTNSVKLVPSMGQFYDIPTVLSDMSIEDTYDADYQTRRSIIYTFNFIIKGYIFGPVSNRGVIKRSIVDLTIPTANAVSIVTSTEGPQVKLTLTPGVLANGSPTSNSSASIPISQISSNSEYGFAFDKEDFFDGINRHNHEK